MAPDAARARNGGVPARRAIARWAWRLFRRDWRQQTLVIALLTVAIAAVIFGASAAYNVIKADPDGFGTGNVRVVFASPDPAALPGQLAAAQHEFGPLDVIERGHVPVPGSVDTVEIRAQQPNGRWDAGMLDLRAGRYPSGAGEVAVTDRVASLLHAPLGGTASIDGLRRVVGIVENPADLHDEFALVSALPASRVDTVTALAHVDGAPAGNAGTRCVICKDTGDGRVEYRGKAERTTGATLVLALSTVALLLVALVATAGFVVVAQRRTRQLGMLAAIGATGRHLKLVTLVNGALTGVIAAVLGATIGLAAWFGLAPRFENAAAHRIDRFDVPWWLVATGMLLALVTATAAAWWPARTAARVPVVDALSARPPVARSTHRSAVAALMCAAGGFTCLAVGINTSSGRANLPLLLAGAVAFVLAVILIGPLAIRLLAAAGSRLPIAPRLALRDLARYRARSSSALAAIAVGLGIAVTVVVIAAGAQNNAAAGNLSNRQLRVDAGRKVVRADAPVAAQRAAVEKVTAALGDATAFPLDVAASPTMEHLNDGGVVRPAAELVRPIGANEYGGLGPLYIATPAALHRFGIDPAVVTPDVDVLTPQRGALFVVAGKVFIGNVPDPRTGQPARLRVAHVDGSRYGSVPKSFVTPAAVERFGLVPVRAGWLIETSRPLTSAQLSAARDAAAHAGLAVEARDEQGGLRTTRTVATLAGILLALAILAMTVGLIRSESGRDLRTLTATGATSHTRRVLTAVTAGALALLGVLVGAAAAYLALVASYLDDLRPLHQVPVGYLAAMAVGLPALAALAGWLLGGREPPLLTRVVLD